MSNVTAFPAGAYRYIDGAIQYSAGVAALPGYRIERVRFHAPLPLAEGFRRIDAILTDAGRPLSAFCACELRSPKPFTEDGFRAFNAIYVVTLAAWKLVDGTRNPVARSNLCPAVDPPGEPSFHAFCYTVPGAGVIPSFVISGSAEAAEGGANYSMVRPGDTTQDGMREKAAFVLDTLESRMRALGFDWSDTTATQVYTVQNVYPFITDELIRRGAARAGFSWHLNRPPVAGLEFEMDCRAVAHELVTL
jgi:hypothetical protein